MSHLRLSLFAGFDATLDGQPITAFGTDKARALLAYLAVAAPRSYRRSDLAALLWPEATDAQAAHNLSQTLLRLRRALGEAHAAAPSPAQPFLRISGQQIQFNPDSDYSLDVADFKALLQAQARHHATPAEDCAACIGWLEQASAYYRGDFLAGFALRTSLPFEEWQTLEQEALHIQALDALTRIVAFYERRGRPDLVCSYARRLLTLEPWHEQAQFQLMTALAACGQETAALEQFAAYRRLLQAEFGMAPATELQALAERIRRRTTVAAGITQDDAPNDATAASAVACGRDERRQVTVLACSWSPAQADADPDERIEAFVRWRARCLAILERYGGWLPPQPGATCLAVFGYPVALEDAARRAAQAALDSAAAADAADVVRCGLHTGVMTVRQGELLGEAPDLADGCQRLAEPGGVWATEDAEHLLRGWFECEPLGQYAPWRQSVPMPLYRVRGPLAGGNRLAWLAQTQRLTRLTGRTAEIEQLLACLAGVQGEGRGCVLALVGEAGIGKSRLVWELKQRSAPTVNWLETRCLPYFQDTSLYPLITLLEQRLHFERTDDAQRKLSKLGQALAQFGLAQAEIVHLFALLLGLTPAGAAPLAINEEQRQQMRVACVTLLTRFASQRPTVLIVEDLHWADPSTLAWLDASLSALAAARCLTLFTLRPTFRPDWLAGRRVRQIELGPLTTDQVEMMAADIAGELGLPDEMRRRVAAQANGVPLFVEELTHLLLAGDERARAGAIPTTLSDLLQARLDRVGAARETAGWAAALGREFPYALLAAAAPLPEARLQTHLAALVEADLLIPSTAGGQARYAFRHALIQEAAAAALPRRTRQAHHRRIAQTYAARFPQLVREQPEIAAQHFAQAGLHAEAAEYWLQAGDRAAGRGATQEARIFFTRALAALDPSDYPRRWRAVAARAAVLFLIGDRAAEQADIETLLALAAQTGQPAWRGEALLRRLKQLNALADFHAMLPLATEIERLAQTIGDPGLEARALCLHAAALTRLGDAAARATAARAVDCGRRAGDEGSIAYATGMLALHEAYAGDYARAAVCWQEVLELVRRTGDRALESRALSNLGAAYQYLGLFDDARAFLEQGIALCALTGDRHSRAYNLVNQGGVLMLSGDLAGARRLFEQGLSEANELGDVHLYAGQLWELGRLDILTGAPATARAHLEEARRIYSDHALTARVMESDALLALCALALGEPQQARQLAGTVWRYLHESGTVGMEEALSTYLALADVFESLAGADAASPEAAARRAVLQEANALVMARADRISDPRWRRSFLDNVPANRAATTRWRLWETPTRGHSVSAAT